jgi:SAM-dependent methyltransferase
MAGRELDSMSVDDYRHLDEVDGSIRAAQKIVPLVLELTGPLQSVVDVGGGTGGWLREFSKAGVDRLALVDSKAVAPHLVIPRECFYPADLELPLPDLGRFDLAASLECAEHLSASRADSLVQWLTSAADIVLFSAAVPGQGGRHHINEQFPRYWAAIFQRFNFIRRDIIRQRILTDDSIPYWYRQNLFLYVKRGHPLDNSTPDLIPDDYVLLHREMEKLYSRPRLGKLLHDIGPAISASINFRIRKMRKRT